MHYPDEKNIHPDTHASTLFPRYFNRGGPLGLIALMKELSSKLSIPITDTIPLIGAFCSESGLTFLKHTQATPLIQSIQHLLRSFTRYEI